MKTLGKRENETPWNYSKKLPVGISLYGDKFTLASIKI